MVVRLHSVQMPCSDSFIQTTTDSRQKLSSDTTWDRGEKNKD